MSNDEMIRKADELERKADMLYMSLLAPSMKEETLRDEAAELRRQAGR